MLVFAIMLLVCANSGQAGVLCGVSDLTTLIEAGRRADVLTDWDSAQGEPHPPAYFVLGLEPGSAVATVSPTVNFGFQAISRRSAVKIPLPVKGCKLVVTDSVFPSMPLLDSLLKPS